MNDKQSKAIAEFVKTTLGFDEYEWDPHHEEDEATLRLYKVEGNAEVELEVSFRFSSEPA